MAKNENEKNEREQSLIELFHERFGHCGDPTSTIAYMGLRSGMELDDISEMVKSVRYTAYQWREASIETLKLNIELYKKPQYRAIAFEDKMHNYGVARAVKDLVTQEKVPVSSIEKMLNISDDTAFIITLLKVVGRAEEQNMDAAYIEVLKTAKTREDLKYLADAYPRGMEIDKMESIMKLRSSKDRAIEFKKAIARLTIHHVRNELRWLI